MRYELKIDICTLPAGLAYQYRPVAQYIIHEFVFVRMNSLDIVLIVNIPCRSTLRSFLSPLFSSAASLPRIWLLTLAAASYLHSLCELLAQSPAQLWPDHLFTNSSGTTHPYGRSTSFENSAVLIMLLV